MQNSQRVGGPVERAAGDRDELVDLGFRDHQRRRQHHHVADRVHEQPMVDAKIAAGDAHLARRLGSVVPALAGGGAVDVVAAVMGEADYGPPRPLSNRLSRRSLSEMR